MMNVLRRSLIPLWMFSLVLVGCFDLAGVDEGSSSAYAAPPAHSDETKVPSLVGLSPKRVEAAIAAAGLVPKYLLGSAPASPEKALTVYRQSPSPGTAAANGARVTITLYSEYRGGVTPPRSSTDQVRLTQIVATPQLNQAEEIVEPRTGLLMLTVTDVTQRAGAVTLEMRRTLQRAPVPPGLLGTQWRSNWETRVTRSGPEAVVYEDTQPVRFSLDKDTQRYRSKSGDDLTFDGMRAVRTRPNGARETFDEQGRLIERDERNGNRFTLAYDAKGRLARIDGPLDNFLRFTADERGRLTKVESSTGATVDYSYEGQRDDSVQSNTARPDSALVVRYAYDVAGMLTSIDHAQFGATKFAYDTNGRVTNRSWSDGTSEQYAYDDATHTLKFTDPTGQVTSTTWSTDGRKSEITTPLGQKIVTEYDAAGRTTALTGPTGQTARLTYDPLGRTVSVDDPRSGTTHLEYLGNTSLLSTIRRASKRQTLEYDAAGNLVRNVDDTDPTQNGTFAYFPNGQASSIILGNGQKTFFTYNAAGRRETVADAAGNTWRYEYDNRGNQVRETDPTGAVTSCSYDAHNRLISVTDSSGAAIRYAYELLGQFYVITSTDARGGISRSTYDQRGRLVSETDAAKRTTKYNYDADGRLTSITDPAGQTYRYEYDAIGSLIAEVDALGGTTKRAYDLLGKLTTVIAPDGTTERYQYSPLGLLMQAEGSSGERTTYDYDAEDRVIAEVDAANQVTQYEYTAAGRVSRMIPPHGPTISYSYDDFGRLTSAQRGEQILVSYQYNALGQRIKEKQASGLETSYRYDAVGNLIGWQDNQRGRGMAEFDAVGRPIATTDAAGSTTRYKYNAAGELMEETDPLGHVRQRQCDLVGQLTAVIEPNGDRASFEYDAAGRLAAATHPGGGKSSYVYDALGNPTQAVDTLGGRIKSTYDSAGRLTRSTDAKGQTTSYTYDDRGRLQLKQLGDGKRVRYEYDGQNRLVKIDDGEFPIAYTFDADGRVTRLEYPAIKRQLEYEYNELGQNTRFVDSEGGTIHYTYDELDRLVSIDAGDKGRVTITYDPKSRVAAIAWKDKVTGTWEYDAEDRPVNIQYRDASGKALAGWKYQFDAAGNPTEVVANDGRATRYSYDPASQLIEESSDGQTVKYSYAAGGNRSKFDASGGDTEYRYNKADQLVAAGQETFRYDANGNMIERKGPKGTTGYGYDAEDRLVRIKLPSGEEISYRYAPTGERVARTDSQGTTYYVCDGANVLAELDKDLKAKARYVHGPGVDQPLVMSRAGELSYFLVDSLGSIRALANEKQGVIAQYDYDGFGQTRSVKGGEANSFRFTSRELDGATGLYYYRARFYDPSLGRFLTRDPVAPDAERVLTLNPYQYAYNAPTRFVDPLGEAPRINMLNGMPPAPVYLSGPRINMLNGKPLVSVPVPPELNPNTKIFHYGPKGAIDAISDSRAINVGTKPHTKGTVHVTTIPPTRVKPGDVGMEPGDMAKAIRTTAGDLAKAGYTLTRNPNRNFPKNTAWIIRPPGGRVKLSDTAGVVRGPRAAGKLIGKVGGVLTLIGVLTLAGQVSAAEPENRLNEFTRGTVGAHVADLAGLVIDGPFIHNSPFPNKTTTLLGIDTTELGNAVADRIAPRGLTLFPKAEPVMSPFQPPPEGFGRPDLPDLLGLSGRDPTHVGKEPLPEGLGPPVELPDEPTGVAPGTPGELIELPDPGAEETLTAVDDSPESVLGPPPKPDPNAKWPICPKCGKRHDPNE